MSVDNSRIAKNTVYLYIRMIFVLGANFFAVRVLLEALGVEDYGLFNLIVGFVTLFTLLNGAMQSTVQRFLCFELGKEKGGDTKAVFAVCLVLFAALAGVILVASETVGLWFVNCKLNIPPGRERSAAIVYQLSILVMLAKTMQIPFTALIVSYERMGVFAKISIVEAALTLGAALALKFLSGDLLIWYTSLYTLATLVVVAVYAGFCRINFAEARFPQRIDRKRIGSIGSFFSWSIFGAVVVMLKGQGLNVLLNVFFGVAFNATWAVSNKISMAVNSLVLNFQQAFKPQIVKVWVESPGVAFFNLLIRTSRWSFFLIWIFALPLLVFPDELMGLWLKGDLPPQLSSFVRLMVVSLVFDAVSGPLWMAVQATGRIAKYQVCVSSLIGSVFFLSWIALCLGAAAWSVMFIAVLIDIACLIFRLYYLRSGMGFPVVEFMRESVCPVLGVVLCGFVVFIFSGRMSATGLLSRVFYIGGAEVANLAAIAFVGLSAAERLEAKQWIFGKMRRVR